jgi:hypothetical protein
VCVCVCVCVFVRVYRSARAPCNWAAGWIRNTELRTGFLSVCHIFFFCKENFTRSSLFIFRSRWDGNRKLTPRPGRCRSFHPQVCDKINEIRRNGIYSVRKLLSSSETLKIRAYNITAIVPFRYRCRTWSFTLKGKINYQCLKTKCWGKYLNLRIKK